MSRPPDLGIVGEGGRARDRVAHLHHGSLWFAAAPMAAALATLRRIRETDCLERTQRFGAQRREGLAKASAAHGYALRQTGPPQVPQILFEGAPPPTCAAASPSTAS